MLTATITVSFKDSSYLSSYLDWLLSGFSAQECSLVFVDFSKDKFLLSWLREIGSDILYPDSSH